MIAALVTRAQTKLQIERDSWMHIADDDPLPTPAPKLYRVIRNDYVSWYDHSKPGQGVNVGDVVSVVKTFDFGVMLAKFTFNGKTGVTWLSHLEEVRP